jgi:nitroreductase
MRLDRYTGVSQPWNTREEDFPANGTETEQLRFLVRYAVLAPSGHNTQPWLFRVEEGRLDLLADRRRALAVVDPNDRELTVSCGAALAQLAVAARYFGRVLDIDNTPEAPDPDCLARARLGARAAATAQERTLFAAIPRRRTIRRGYDDRPLSDVLAQACVAAAAGQGAQLTLIADAQRRARVADLVAEGDRIQFADPRFRRELAAWVRSRRSQRREGISGEAFGMPDVLSFLGAAVVRTFDIGKGVAAGDRQKVMAPSAVLAVLGTAGDAVSDWLRAGRALSHVLLTLTCAGASAAYLNQPIEVAALRPRLREALALDGCPQLLMRLGYAPAGRPAVRRPLADVLL